MLPGSLHARSVTTLEATLRHLVDVESAGRGFALTGREPFLETYETGTHAILQDIHTLRALVADNPLRNSDWTRSNSK